MKKFSCPSCSADITVQSKHVNLAVCPSCQTSVLVDKKAVTVSGKMSLLALTPGPLFVHGTGKLGKRRFTVLGRVRYGYEAGFWDEWYLAFEQGEFGWISEDEFNYTFEKRTPLASIPVDYASANPGDFIKLGKEDLHVDEKGIAICEGAEGELPFVVEQGEKIPYLDLSAGKIYATLEYDLDGSATLYHGRRLNLDRLKMDMTAEEMGLVAPPLLADERAETDDQRERIVRSTERSQKLNCFACGGTLAIPENPPDEMSCEFCGTATDLSLEPCGCPHCAANIPLHGGRQVKSMVCPSCKMQVDVTRPDKPVLLESLAASKRPKSAFKLGQPCQFDGLKYIVIGMVKYRQQDGISYYWTDYLLYNKTEGYRWLTLENGHFTLSKEIDERPKNINPKKSFRKQKFNALGRKWRVFEVFHGLVEIVYVDGELPWVAKLGDRHRFMDAIDPPFLLSAEWTKREMEWSLSEYKTREEIEAAFKLPENSLHKPVGVAPCQPSNVGSFRKQAMTIMLMVFALNLFFMCSSFIFPGKQISSFQVTSQQYKEPFITQSFTVTKKNAICQINFNAPVSNAWVYLDVAVVDKDDKALLDFSAEMSYYSGVEGGESWSEGSQSDSKIFKLKEPGEYRLLVKGAGGRGDSPDTSSAKPVNIEISQGVFPARYFIILTVLALIWVIIEWWRRFSFEAQRWGADDDDDD